MSLHARCAQFGNIVPGVFTPVLAKHSKSFSLIDCVSVGVDRMQRNFEPMRKQVEAWQRSELTAVTAKVVIYEAFVEGKLEAPKHLARTVHDLYFEPKYEEFRSRTIWISRMRSRRHSRNWSRSRIQGNGKARGVLGGRVFASVLVCEAVSAGRRFFLTGQVNSTRLFRGLIVPLLFRQAFEVLHGLQGSEIPVYDALHSH